MNERINPAYDHKYSTNDRIFFANDLSRSANDRLLWQDRILDTYEGPLGYFR